MYSFCQTRIGCEVESNLGITLRVKGFAEGPTVQGVFSNLGTWQAHNLNFGATTANKQIKTGEKMAVIPQCFLALNLHPFLHGSN